MVDFGGLCFLFFLALIGIPIVSWWSFWVARLPANWPVTISRRWLCTLVACLIGLLPIVPMRRCGVWISTESETPANAIYSAQLDRFFFGYIPSWKVIASIGDLEVLSGQGFVGIDPYPLCRLSECHWRIDWLALTIEAAIVLALLSPFLFLKTEASPRQKRRRQTHGRHDWLALFDFASSRLASRIGVIPFGLTSRIRPAT